MIKSRAWSQGIIVVLNSETVKTAQIEENFAKVDPSIESYVFTFNTINDLIQFSKLRNDIRLCILPDIFEEMPATAIFDNIKNQITTAGTDPRAIFTYSNPPRLDIYRQHLKHHDVLDYISIHDLTAETPRAHYVIGNLFKLFVDNVENQIIPEELGHLILDLANFQHEKFELKYDRLSTLIGSQMNLSFSESVLLKWLPYLEKVFSEINSSNLSRSLISKKYLSFKELEKQSDHHSSVILLASKEIQKIAALPVTELTPFFQNLKSTVRPSSGAIHRILSRNSDRIISISLSIEDSSDIQHSGVA